MLVNFHDIDTEKIRDNISERENEKKCNVECYLDQIGMQLSVFQVVWES